MRYRPVRTKKMWGRTIGEKGILFVATGFYVGYAPVVPGTFGTLVGIPIAFFLAFLPPWEAAIALVGMILGACWVADAAEKMYGVKDPNDIVIDEVVGYLVTVWGVPFHWGYALAGFILFRVFDIVKPFPIRKIERWIPGGAGIVLDDVLAGMYGCLILHLVWMRYGHG